MTILFITPYGIRSGSEIAIWNIIAALDPGKYKSHVFCKGDGPLLRELPPHVKFDVSNYQLSSTASRMKNRLSLSMFKKGLLERQLAKIQKEFKPELWYLNTAIMPDIAEIAVKNDIPYAVHFHELESVYSSFKDYMLEEMVTNAKITIGCSSAVCDNLKIMGSKNVELIYEAVDTEKIDKQAKVNPEIRSKLGLDPNQFLWGMSGASSYRKGFDLFVDIAAEFQGKAQFIWIGRDRDLGFDYYAKSKIKYHNLDNIRIAGEQSDKYYDYLNSIDGFMLTSREDPFPLVMIEAGYLGKPLVAFESGGAKEFIVPGTGFCTTGINKLEMIEKMSVVMNGIDEFDTGLIRENAAQYNLKNQAIQWQQMINEYFK